MSPPVKYSLDEIDRLRDIIYMRVTWDLDGWDEREIDNRVEGQLRTAMIAGVSVEDEEETFKKLTTAIRLQDRDW